jgi:SWI/SNF-related matrix-associated actin-dependent regulator of chromatin subfamily A protein 2/4
VIHLEAVADAPRGAAAPPPSDPTAAAAAAAGRELYADSIESLVRNEIQRTKIEMANEVIDAGR